MTDRALGYSKGFGFVRYATLEDAARGIEGMNGKVSTSDQWILSSDKIAKISGVLIVINEVY